MMYFTTLMYPLQVYGFKNGILILYCASTIRLINVRIVDNINLQFLFDDKETVEKTSFLSLRLYIANAIDIICSYIVSPVIWPGAYEPHEPPKAAKERATRGCHRSIIKFTVVS